jgi:hypothetical protein
MLQAVLIYFGVAQRFPLSGDDFAYVYQARVFAPESSMRKIRSTTTDIP